MTAGEIIQHLQLRPHPEGGFYKEVYRSEGLIEEHCLPKSFGGSRHHATSIYYLLQCGDYSAFHRIKSDEIWHFYAGGSLLLHLLSDDGVYQRVTLGSDLAKGATFQFVMPAGVWFAAEPAPGTDFTLAGCTVSPGFDFRDFELADGGTLGKDFPELKELIMRLCR
jgi:uncharacterized protein